MVVKATLTAAVAALVAAGFAAAAQAAPAHPANSDAPSVTIQTAGLDLNSQAGAQIVLHRIHMAAEAICGGAPDSHALGDVQAFKACVTATTDQAVASLGSPLVASLAGGGSPVTGASLAER